MPPRILLIHGYLSNPAAWAPLQRELGGEVETFAPHLPGYGGEPDPADYTLAGLAAALDAEVADFRPDYLLGHSMGALVALELASRHRGRLRGVGLAGAPVFDTIEEGIAYMAARSRSRSRYLRNPGKSHALCAPLNALRYLWAPIARLCFRGYPLPMLLSLFDHSAEAHRGGIEQIVFAGHAPRLAAQVETPVALLHGDRDRVTPLAPAAALARERGWPLRVAHGAGHEAIFTQPRGAARWVRERLLAPSAAGSEADAAG